MSEYTNLQLALQNPLDVTALDLTHQNGIHFNNFSKFIHLADLRLMDTGLTEFPQQILLLKKLRRLHLDYNQLTSLPNKIAQLKNSLEIVSLTHNQFDTFPEAILELIHLKELYLYNNRITQLPERINQLKELTQLGVGLNRLSTLPESIGFMPQLQRLDIADNRIHLAALPKKIQQVLKRKKTHQAGNIATFVGGMTVIEECITHLMSLKKNHDYVPPKEFTQVQKWHFNNDRPVPKFMNRWLQFDPYFKTVNCDNTRKLQFDLVKQKILPTSLSEAIQTTIEGYLERSWNDVVIQDVNKKRVWKGDELCITKVKKMRGEWYQLPHIGDQIHFLYVESKKKLFSNDQEYPIIGVEIEISSENDAIYMIEPIFFIKYVGFDSYLAHLCELASDEQVWKDPTLIKLFKKFAKIYKLPAL
ncbi:MAG TPA: leucine-rich repeat domain-containing protein [Patescibacteria group bacterium]|nr:leucine-rich repeat domain-containing protein [Patescibacteria group bacterium]